MTYQKIEWTKAFILHQERYLKPINYFKLQARYSSFELGMKARSTLQESTDTKNPL